MNRPVRPATIAMCNHSQDRPALHLQVVPQSKAISSEDLLQGEKEVLIKHCGEVYRLRLTRNGKLILHK